MYVRKKVIGSIASFGTTVVHRADKPEATNPITEPDLIVLVTSKVKGPGKSFSRSFPAYSITVLQIERWS